MVTKTLEIQYPLDVCESCKFCQLEIEYHDMIADDKIVTREYRAYCSNETLCRYVHGKAAPNSE